MCTTLLELLERAANSPQAAPIVLQTVEQWLTVLQQIEDEDAALYAELMGRLDSKFLLDTVTLLWNNWSSPVSGAPYLVALACACSWCCFSSRTSFLHI